MLDLVVGYSETPLAKKIGIKEGTHVALVHAAMHWRIDAVPANVTVTRRIPNRRSDVVAAFFFDPGSFLRELESLTQRIVPNGSRWLAWTRRAGDQAGDLTDNSARSAALAIGLFDAKVSRLNDDWSALTLVWRNELRRDRV